jgi:hypothetical protein
VFRDSACHYSHPSAYFRLISPAYFRQMYRL